MNAILRNRLKIARADQPLNCWHKFVWFWKGKLWRLGKEEEEEKGRVV